MSRTSPSSSKCVHRSKIASGAPFAIRRCLPSISTITDITFLKKSNGTSSTFLYCFTASFWWARMALSSRFLRPVW